MTAIGVEAISGTSDAVRHDLARLKEASGKIVGRMFFGTLLKTMRESSLGTGMGRGGRGEAVFAAQLHEIYAERMGTAAHGGLKDVLYESLKPQQERISGRQGLAAC